MGFFFSKFLKSSGISYATTQVEAEEQSTESDAESTTNEDNEGVVLLLPVALTVVSGVMCLSGAIAYFNKK